MRSPRMTPTLGPTAKRKKCLAMEDAGSTSLTPGKIQVLERKWSLCFPMGDAKASFVLNKCEIERRQRMRNHTRGNIITSFSPTDFRCTCLEVLSEPWEERKSQRSEAQ